VRAGSPEAVRDETLTRWSRGVLRDVPYARWMSVCVVGSYARVAGPAVRKEMVCERSERLVRAADVARGRMVGAGWDVKGDSTVRVVLPALNGRHGGPECDTIRGGWSRGTGGR